MFPSSIFLTVVKPRLNSVPDDNTLDLSKLKALTDDKLLLLFFFFCYLTGEHFLLSGVKHCSKVGNACNQHFLLYSYFSHFFPRSSKLGFAH